MYEEVSKKYPDKTVLIWVFPMNAEDIDLDAVNKRLIDPRKDYVLSLSSVFPSSKINTGTSYISLAL